MRNKLQQRKDSGFTIIEVLIVLAIAGLIMVVVFLAVPALQRSGRNNALNTSANNLFTGVNNFVSNNNGTLPTGPSAATAPASGVVTFTGAAGSNSETVNVDQSIATVKVDDGSSPITKTSVVGTVEVITGTNAKCNSTKSGISGTGTNRSVALLYVAESGSGNIVKCLD